MFGAMLTPRRTRNLATIVTGTGLGLVFAQILTHLFWTPVPVLSYLCTLMVTLVAGAVAVLATAYGHVEDAFKAGLDTSGRSSTAAFPVPARVNLRRLAIVAAAPLVGLAIIPVMGTAASSSGDAPTPVPSASPTPVETPTATTTPTTRGGPHINECYRLIDDSPRQVTCEPLKDDTRGPRAKAPACWLWVNAGKPDQTLARVDCDDMRNSQGQLRWPTR